MPYKFSPSSLKILKDCPRCFYLQFNENVKRPRGIFPSLPGGMDRILKVYFDSFRSDGGLPPELSELRGVKLFDDVDLLEVWRNNFKGVQWADKEGNILRGAVDEILQRGKKLIVLDYKTRGWPPKDETPGYYQEQLDIYNFLLRKNGYKTEDYGYLIFYHPDRGREGGDIAFHTDLVKMKTSVKNAEKFFKEGLSVLSGDLPEASEECEYCKFVRERGGAVQTRLG